MSLDSDLRLGTKPAAAVTDEVVPGLVWGVRCRGPSAVRVTEELAPPAVGEWLWLHVNLADTRTQGWLAGCKLVPQAGIERLVSKDDVQQLVPLGDAVAGVFFDMVHDFDRASEEFGLVRFVLTDRVLITGRRRAMRSVEAVRRRIEAGHRYASPVDLVVEIVDQIALAIDVMVDELGTEIDSVEDTILREGDRDDRLRLGHARLTTVRVHRRLNALRGLFRRVSMGTGDGLMQSLRGPAAAISQRLDELDHEVIELRDRARLLQEELGARVAEQTNRHLQLLAVLTAVFLPPTLIAGLFGMNLGGAPFMASPLGFWLALAVTVLSSVATLVGLRWAGVFK